MQRGPYLYQSRPDNHPAKPLLWSVGGEGSTLYAGQFFIKKDAKKIVDNLTREAGIVRNPVTQGRLGLE